MTASHEEREYKLRPAAPLILDRVGAGTAEVAHRFIAGVGHMHRRQFARPVQPRQLERVPPVGLDPVPAPARDQRRGHDGAVDLQLRAAARDDEARRPRLIADPQLGPGMGLFQFGKDLLQAVQVIGDGAVEASFAAPAFGEGDGDVFRMDIESDEQVILSSWCACCWLV